MPTLETIAKLVYELIARLRTHTHPGQAAHVHDYSSAWHGHSKLLMNWLDLLEITPPATPPANVIRIYNEDFKGFSFLNFIDDRGMVRKIVRDSVFVGKNDTLAIIPEDQPYMRREVRGMCPRSRWLRQINYPPCRRLASPSKILQSELLGASCRSAYWRTSTPMRLQKAMSFMFPRIPPAL